MIQWIWVLGLETNLIFSLHHPGHLESWKNWKETLGHPGHSGRNLLAAAAAKSLQLCPTLCNPVDGSPPRLRCPWDSSGKNSGVGCHCLLQKSPWQEHMSQWVGEQGAGTCRVYKCESRVKVLLGGKTRSIYKSECVCAQSLQLCLTLCDPMGFNPPGFSVHGILQARILAWVAIPSSRGSSQPRGQTRVSCISCIAGGFFTHRVTWEAHKGEWNSSCSVVSNSLRPLSNEGE